MAKINKKEIISLVKNDFIPLEESKEGALKGGFGSIMIETETSLARGGNNCMCNGNNCMWCNEGKDNCDCPNGMCAVGNGDCKKPSERGNNCNCDTTVPPTTGGTSGESPITTTSNFLMGAGFSF